MLSISEGQVQTDLSYQCPEPRRVAVEAVERQEAPHLFACKIRQSMYQRNETKGNFGRCLPVLSMAVGQRISYDGQSCQLLPDLHCVLLSLASLCVSRQVTYKMG